MSYSHMLSPEMLEVLLPLMGLSILLNVVLLAALVVKSIHTELLHSLRMLWIGIQITARLVRRSHRASQVHAGK